VTLNRRRRALRAQLVETPDGVKRVGDMSDDELLLAAYARAVTALMKVREALEEVESRDDAGAEIQLRDATRPDRAVLAALIHYLHARSGNWPPRA
jgi:hypothetical protein